MNRTRRTFPEYRLSYSDSTERFPTREAAWARFSELMHYDVRNLRVWGCPFGSQPVCIWSDTQEHARRDAQALREIYIAADRDLAKPDLDDDDLAEIAAEARLNCY